MTCLHAHTVIEIQVVNQWRYAVSRCATCREVLQIRVLAAVKAAKGE